MHIKIVQKTDKNEFTDRYVQYLTESLTTAGIPFDKLLDTGYEPDYQGCLLILIAQEDIKDQLEDICTNDWELGDDSYGIIQIDEHTYLIDICQ